MGNNNRIEILKLIDKARLDLRKNIHDSRSEDEIIADYILIWSDSQIDKLIKEHYYG